MAEPSTEIRFVRLELGHQANSVRLESVEDRVKSLEQNHSEQISVLARLGQTVEILADTVATLSELTRELDKSQEVFRARFNITIAILSAIGIAVITGVAKLLFFTGAAL